MPVPDPNPAPRAQPSANTPPGLEGDLAVSLSGGGYRAAAYHLGVLDVLDRVGLLDRLTTLSTISGGTITGAAYAVSLVRGESFNAFYRRLYGALGEHHVVDDALARVFGGKEPLSLIRAAAGVYADEAFVGDTSLGDVAALDKGPQEFVFSATELHSGNAYRFQTSRRSRARVGTTKMWVPNEVASRVRLADVVAASSCFPGAFEPFRFPDDFAWDGGVEAVRAKLGFGHPVPLMDGGLYDNQGIDGVRTVYERRRDDQRLREGLGLFFLSDTSRDRTPMFESEDRRGRGTLTIGGVRLIGRVAAGAALAWVMLAGLLAMGVVGDGSFARVVRGYVTVVSWVVALGVLGTWAWGRTRVRAWLEDQGNAVRVPIWRRVRDVPVRDAVRMGEVRLRAVFALLTSVSTKRVRRLIQTSVHTGGGFEGRFADALIYGLTRTRRSFPWMEPSEGLVALAEAGTEAPTTLWFDDPSRLPSLVACGQATACHSLIEFLIHERGVCEQFPHTLESRTFERLRAVWERLQADPFALIHERGLQDQDPNAV